MAHWYTADPRFGHEAIISHCARPFASGAEMDAALLAALRATVGPRDDLWILGDLALGPAARDGAWLARLFRQLPGARRHLVTGSHDGAATRALPWDTVAPLAETRNEGTRLVFCHDPLLTWPSVRRGALHLFGHVHDRWPGARGAVNVGVDLWGFRAPCACPRSPHAPPRRPSTRSGRPSSRGRRAVPPTSHRPPRERNSHASPTAVICMHLPAAHTISG